MSPWSRENAPEWRNWGPSYCDVQARGGNNMAETVITSLMFVLICAISVIAYRRGW